MQLKKMNKLRCYENETQLLCLQSLSLLVESEE